MTVDNFIPPFNSGRSTYIEALSDKLEEYVAFVKESGITETYVIPKIEHLNDIILSAILDIKQANSQNAYSRIYKYISDEKDSIELPTYIINTNILNQTCNIAKIFFIFPILYDIKLHSKDIQSQAFLVYICLDVHSQPG